MARPISSTPLNDGGGEEGTLALISYGEAHPFSGNLPVGAGAVTVEAGPLSLESFLFVGSLSDQYGAHELSNRISNYDELPNDGGERTLYLAGGRFGLNLERAALTLEGMQSGEGLLQRRFALVELRGDLPGAMGCERLEPWVRFEQQQILDADAPLSDGSTLRQSATAHAVTWDWRVASGGLSAFWRDRKVGLHLLVALIGETTGDESPGSEHPLLNQQFANNETTMQLELRF